MAKFMIGHFGKILFKSQFVCQHLKNFKQYWPKKMLHCVLLCKCAIFKKSYKYVIEKKNLQGIH
jgi:hypothetical protein